MDKVTLTKLRSKSMAEQNVYLNSAKESSKQREPRSIKKKVNLTEIPSIGSQVVGISNINSLKNIR